ncbi:MAG: hypothetical protein LBB44_03285 [Endomicrobium sp.]|jgi:hypothetical protein|nr:hypothetical protein [Endomicrobium sp.]
MNKFIASLISIFIMAPLASAKPNNDRELVVKLGFQPQSEISVNGKNENMNAGLSGGIEFFKYLGNIIALGLGTTIDLPREIKKKELKGSMSCLPIYVGAKARTPLHGLDDTYAFLSGRFGYSSPMGKDLFDSATGGLYLSLGLGIDVDYFVLEAVYAKHTFGTNNSIFSKPDYSTITLYAGFKFE